MAASLDSRIRSVVVYRNGALVTRRAAVDVVGAADVVVPGLPLTLVSDTVRVRPVDDACVVGAVDEVCAVDVVDAAPRDDAAAVAARVAVEAKESERALLKLLVEHADVGVELPPDDVDAAPSARVLLALHSAGAKRRAALQAALRAVEQELRVLKDQAAAAEQLLRRDPTPPRVQRGVRIGLVTTRASAVDVEYFVPAARWLPSYALHLTTRERGAHARLVLGALVAQASGEDWTDVDLAVSTVDLRRDTTLPTLHSWRLGRAQAQVAKGFRPLPSDLPTLFSGYDKFNRSRSAQAVELTDDSGAGAPKFVVAPSSPPPEPLSVSLSLAKPSPPPAPPPPSAPLRPMELAMVSAAPSVDEDGAPPPEMSMERMRRSAGPPPAAKSMAMPMPSLAAPAPVGAAFGGLGFPGSAGGGPQGAPAPTVVDELPPRLRTSSMRLAGPEESQRGLLLPLDALARLAWLLDAHDLKNVSGVDGAAAHGELQRAVNALRAAEDRLRHRPLPRGTRALGDSIAAVYDASARTSVPSDGNDHRVEVYADESQAEFVHLAVPRAAPDVWRALPLTLHQAVPPGPVQVYEDGAFVVAGVVDGGGGGKPLMLNLGVDPDVRIKDRTPHTHQQEKGVLGGTTVVEHRIVTEVLSTKKQPVKLRLFERIPIADDSAKDLVVSPVTSKPAAQRTERGPHDEPLAGGLRFDLTLMPGDKMVVEHSYTLTLPAKSEVVGGNRRE